MPAGTLMDPDRLAALEEERRFLLRSLADLERERDAGDVDDDDYRELRDGYTARAASILRAIESGRAALAPQSPVDWRRRIVGAVVVVALIGVVWWALSASSAQRLPGQQISGFDPRDRTAVLLSQARSLQASDPATAADLYEQVLDDDPDHAEALAYRGWTLALSVIGTEDADAAQATLDEAVQSLVAAIEVDRTYPDPYCFLGIVQYRFFGDAETALPFIEGCLSAGPPADVRSLVEGLREQVVAEVADAGE
jgi:tetratricopeptide (TPR) repeat protein